MQQSFIKNYLNIYIFQIISIVLNLLSLLIVIPFLSSEKSIYGIYSVCVSISVYFSYADFGFLGAGLKYAAEYYSKNDRENEIKILGFSHMVLAFFVILVSIVILSFSFYPNLIIKQITSPSEINIASSLLLILAIFSPTIIIQRCLQAIFNIRIKDYLLQKINIISNIIKLLSISFFFTENKYQIVNYYLFTQIINLLTAIIGIFIAKKTFNYDFLFLLKNMKFNNDIFNKTKGLAFSGIVMTFSWILYYELDALVIGKFLGLDNVALYSIGFTILTFTRSILGIFFSPFSSRFNHFVGTSEKEKLSNFFSHIIKISFPIVVFPILGLYFFATPLIISWVGNDYYESIVISKLLILCNIMGFISYPAGLLMSAELEIKKMYIIGFLMPIIYWLGIIVFYNYFGLITFAILKLLIFTLSGFYFFSYTLQYLNITFFFFIRKYIFPYISGFLFMIFFSYYVSDKFIVSNNKYYLLLNMCLLLFGFFISILLSSINSSYLRIYILNSYKKLFKNGL